MPMKRLDGFEGANGTFCASEEDAIASILAGVEWGQIHSALADNGDINVSRIRAAILRAAEIIQKKKRK